AREMSGRAIPNRSGGVRAEAKPHAGVTVGAEASSTAEPNASEAAGAAADTTADLEQVAGARVATAAAALAEFCAVLRWDALERPVRERALELVLDLLGVALAGS